MYFCKSKTSQKKIDLVEDSTLMPFAEESANHDKQLIYE